MGDSTTDDSTTTTDTSSDTKQLTTMRTPWRTVYLFAFCAFIQMAQYSLFFNSMWPYLRTLDRNATEEQYGAIVASYNLASAVFSPIFSYFGVMHAKRANLCGISMMLIGNALYFCLQFLRSDFALAMLIARIIAGGGSGNTVIFRVYIANASAARDKTKTLSIWAGAFGAGIVLGPVFQLMFTPLGEAGVNITPYININIYTAPALLCCFFNAFIIILLKFFFVDELKQKRREAKINKDFVKPKPDYGVLFSLNLQRFVMYFINSVFEALLSPLSMLMFSLSNERAVAYNSVVHGVCGAMSILLTVLLVPCNLARLISERPVLICAIVGTLLTIISSYPFDFFNQNVKLNFNGTGEDCDVDRFDWCYGTNGVNFWVFYISFVFNAAIFFPLMNITATSLYSFVTGPFPDGKVQGVFDTSSALGRLAGPVVSSYLYTIGGPKLAWQAQAAVVTFAGVIFILFYRKTVPIEGKTNEKNKG